MKPIPVQIKVPKGWRLVRRGLIIKGDLEIETNISGTNYQIINASWIKLTDDYLRSYVSDREFGCVLRKATRKVASKNSSC